MNNKVKKPLPATVTKAKLIEMYCNQFSAKEILRQVNEIIKEKNFTIRKKLLPQIVFIEFYETYGIPKDYFFEDND